MFDIERKWYVSEESSERPGFCCLAVREEETQRLVADLADHPLDATEIVKRSRDEARVIALVPQLVGMLERLLYAAETRKEWKYRDGNLYRETREEAYNLLDRVKGLK